MQTTLATQLSDLVKLEKKDITTLLAKAAEIGISKLWD
jgi:hypothetical protein